MFWKKKEPCFHEWKVSDFRTNFDIMGDRESNYEITCIKCNKQRILGVYTYEKMKDMNLIVD